MDYVKAREYLQETPASVPIMGLSNITNLLDEIGNPQDDLKFIHIAGTNGKGSVMAYISTILQAAGYRVGRYISPTIYGYRERIQINDEYIAKDAFAKHMTTIAEAIGRMEAEGLAKPTPFEIETALSFLHFAKERCDLVVLESGMGGRDDATNVVHNTVLAILTSISMDHMEFLGEDLVKIARNKAGIIKDGAVVICDKQAPEVEEAIWAICTERGNSLVIANPSVAVIRESTLKQQTFRYQGEEITISLAGAHQIDNAVLALEGIKALIHLGYNISPEDISRGFVATKWNGRFTVLREEPYFVVDGAHNPAAASKLAQSLKMYFPERKFIFIMGMLKDKQYDKIAEMMAPLADWIFTIATPDHPRALAASDLAATVAKYNHQVVVCDTIDDAVQQSFASAGEKDVIVAFGSLSFIGEITRCVTGELEHLMKASEDEE